MLPSDVYVCIYIYTFRKVGHATIPMKYNEHKASLAVLSPRIPKYVACAREYFRQKLKYRRVRNVQLAKASMYLCPFSLPSLRVVHIQLCTYTDEYNPYIHRSVLIGYRKPTKNSIFFVPSRRSLFLDYCFCRNEKNNGYTFLRPNRKT